jgi:hypothetical protein
VKEKDKYQKLNSALWCFSGVGFFIALCFVLAANENQSKQSSSDPAISPTSTFEATADLVRKTESSGKASVEPYDPNAPNTMRVIWNGDDMSKSAPWGTE